MKTLSVFALAAAVVSACAGAQPQAPSASSRPQSADAVSAGSAASSSSGEVSPRATGPNRFDPPPLEGWESSKWHDLTHASPKYVFGRALVGLDPTEDNLRRVADAQGLIYIGNGRVRFGGGAVVDMIYDLGGSKAHWHYAPE